MNRNEAVVCIKAALYKYADHFGKHNLDVENSYEARHMAFLRADIDGISTIGEAFRVMHREHINVPDAVRLAFEAVLEDSREDEFRAVPIMDWSA